MGMMETGWRHSSFAMSRVQPEGERQRQRRETKREAETGAARGTGALANTVTAAAGKAVPATAPLRTRGGWAASPTVKEAEKNTSPPPPPSPE